MSSIARLISIMVLTASCLIARPTGSVAQTVFAAVWGDPKQVVGSSTLNSGLFRSSDLGLTWTHLGPQNLKTFSMDAVDAERGRVLYIAAGNGVHRSLDSGRTWRIVTDWRITEVLDVAVDQQEPRRIYAATATGLWKSSDGGERWGRDPGEPGQTYMIRVVVTGDTVQALSDSRLFISTDRGEHWRQRTAFPGMRDLAHDGATSIAFTGGIATMSPERPDEFLRSGPADAGQWYAITPDGRTAAGDSGVVAMEFEPERGVRVARWRDIGAGLPASQVLSLAYLDDADVILAGTWGDGVYRREDARIASGAASAVNMKALWKPSGLEGTQVWRVVVRGW
jgi:hypothetical protein